MSLKIKSKLFLWLNFEINGKSEYRLTLTKPFSHYRQINLLIREFTIQEVDDQKTP